jgi:hypothetical protein
MHKLFLTLTRYYIFIHSQKKFIFKGKLIQKPLKLEPHLIATEHTVICNCNT